MSSQGFQFKQFFINHTQCAMKVGTDSIMLGSWVNPRHSLHILDIGTGSGLLAIMMAQKASSESHIYGIDIDKKAVEQAKLNAENCPWQRQLSFENRSLLTLEVTRHYDLIISNPPYFAVNVTANNEHSNSNRINARQTVALDHQGLLERVVKHLTADGKFYCVLPSDVSKRVVDYAQTLGLYCNQALHVCSKEGMPVSRMLLAFSFDKGPQATKTINIYNSLGKYSEEYTLLCKDYYLNF